MDVSGVLSVVCNHIAFRPGATVDLQTTEMCVTMNSYNEACD